MVADSPENPSASQPLRRLSLLLVRPVQASVFQNASSQGHSSQNNDDFILAASQLGASVHHSPVMNIISIPAPLVAESLQQSDINIFVSRAAAQLALVQSESSGLALLRNTPCYAVGKSTAAILSASGISAETPTEQMTSEGLLLLPALGELVNRRVTIFSGVGGRTLLFDELQSKGADVQRVELYRREPCGDKADEIIHQLESGQLTMIVVHSGELLKNLLSIVETNAVAKRELLQLPVLVPSERVAMRAADAKFDTVITAASAMPEDMVSAIVGWYSEQ